jgi:hypothetical protein
LLAGLRVAQQKGEMSIDSAGVRFEDLPKQAWPRHEIIDGSLHVTPLVGVPHQIITTNLTVALAPKTSILPSR